MTDYRRAFLIALCLLPSSLWAQGFDCNKAQTPIERLICSNPEIGALDRDLNIAVQARLAAAPQDRSNFLDESRQWLTNRNKTCAVPTGSLSAQQQDVAITCLKKLYRTRLDKIAELSSAQDAAADSRKMICNRFVESYRMAIAKQGDGSGGNNTLLEQRPFDLLAKNQDSGVTRAQELVEISELNQKKLERWAQGQKPPIQISTQVKKAILNLGSSETLSIDHAPQTNFYVASETGGSASCIESIYFRVKNGTTEQVKEPIWPHESMDSCGVYQFFGSIDGSTVAVEDDTSHNLPDISQSLEIKTWSNDSFGQSCAIIFNYDPVFVDGTSESPLDKEEKCLSPACVALKPEAKKLVEAVQKAPLAAQKNASDRLTKSQHESLITLERLSFEKQVSDVPPPEKPTDPDSYLNYSPLQLPIVYKGEVYLASIGHFTIGWRIYADWTVKIEKLDNGDLQTLGIVYFTSKRGSLRSATVM